ncbi:hypothetical protein HK099_000969 [Clydaea vesicula]|uniref:Uncharacterized protein n=1 Tax=Clydaea vesicula TaxID=447962 RepID=A0AAD5U6Y9_9FUNG|nr:hypothetical protein HK099_000969 [Clydaea vesicula]
MNQNSAKTQVWKQFWNSFESNIPNAQDFMEVDGISNNSDFNSVSYDMEIDSTSKSLSSNFSLNEIQLNLKNLELEKRQYARIM